MMQLRFLVPILLLLACAAAAEIPVSDSSYTAKDYRDDLLAMNREMLVGTYRRIGSRDPAWDDAVIAYLDAQAIRITNGSVTSRLELLAPSNDQQAAWRKAALDAGCDEPLVLYFQTNVVGRTDRGKALAMARQVYAAMVERGDPDYRVLQAANHVLKYLPRGPERDAMFHTYYGDAARAMLARQPDRLWNRAAIAWIDPDDSTQEAQRYYDAAQAMEDADPWAVGLICGIYHIKAAWDARGGGWASTVTDEGWQGFGEHLAEAKKHLKAAWAIDPSLPEPADEMIAVCMAGHGDPGDSERLWFERAVSAQFDYLAAYGSYQWAMRPRWGGSHELMLAHAAACVDTGRFDTDVPFELTDILRAIADDHDGSWDFIRDPAIWPLVQRFFEGITVEPTRKKNRDYLLSYYAVAAWRCGQYAKARQLLEDLGDRHKVTAAKWLDASPDRVQDQTYALTGVAADRFRAGDAAIRAGDIAAARQHYEQARATPGLDPLSRRYAEHRLQQFRWQDEIQAGQPVSLVPDPDLQPADQLTLAGLNVQRGEWTAVDQTLIAESTGYGVEARLANPVGSRFRLSATLDFGINDHPDRLAGGLITYWESNKTSHQFLVKPGSGHRDAKNWSTRGWTEAKVPDHVELVLEQWDDKRAMFIDGERVRFDDVHHDADYPSIGFGTPSTARGVTMVFENPTVQVLTTRPAWVDAWTE